MEFNIIKEKITSRGGGIQISLDNHGYPGAEMTAYQNYLGGGMLSSIGFVCTVPKWSQKKDLKALSEKLGKHLHSKTNPPSGWESATYKQLQKRPISAY